MDANMQLTKFEANFKGQGFFPDISLTFRKIGGQVCTV